MIVRGLTVAGTALVTVKVDVDAFTDPNTAEMLAVPAARLVANPAFAPKSWMVAVEASDEFHCTKSVMSC